MNTIQYGKCEVISLDGYQTATITLAGVKYAAYISRTPNPVVPQAGIYPADTSVNYPHYPESYTIEVRSN
jgi:hypothetical protein